MDQFGWQACMPDVPRVEFIAGSGQDSGTE